jgi:glucosamine--fructose-6-phosphate aminotransferase (isomerizing)
MCGIIGYIGSEKAQPMIIDGLKRLEYRGYDSAGLALLENGKIDVIRAKGKLNELITKIQGRDFSATVGIGHTRWATHGKPDEVNAHPHSSADVVLVHNGIIENHQELKMQLLSKGHRITSETDSEVICHLIQDHLDNNEPIFQAILKTLAVLHGAYSLVILHKQSPDTIFAVKKGSPLVVGLKSGESFVASDVPAFLSHTNSVVFLEDEEAVILQKDKVEFFDFAGKTLHKKTRKISWTAAQAEKGGYKHFMLKEIMEQPRVLADTLSGRIDRKNLMASLGEADALIDSLAKNPNAKIQIIACGTSWHAGLVAAYWIENLARIPVRVDLSSEFRYRKPLVDPNTLVIPISQSGETADTIAAIKESQALGSQVLAVCNVLESSIPRLANATAYTLAGPEIGVASTKAFLTQMAVLYLMTLRLATKRDLMNKDALSIRLQALIELPNLMEAFLHDLKNVPALAEKIYKHQHCYFIGRGIEFPVVLEGALKLKEISYVHAEGYAGGEMKHGPIALIEEGTPVVAIAVKDSLHEKMISNVQQIKARGANIFGLTSEDDVDSRSFFDFTIAIPNAHEDLLPFLTVVPLQLLAYEVADRKGTDVDQPRNLAKSVTVE